MSWQIFTVISVITLSASVLLQRILLSKDKLDPYAYVVIFQAIVGSILMLFTLFFGFKLPGIENYILPATLSIVAFGLGHIAYAKTLQLVEASAFSVLFATQAVWIMFLGILLFNESLTYVQIVGTVLIFGSVLLLVKNLNKIQLDKSTLWGLLTGLLFGIAITSWSYVGRYTDPLSWAAISFVATALFAYLIRPQTIRKMPELLRGRIIQKLLILGVLYAIGSLAMLYAYREGAFAVVTPLRQTSIIITVLLALLFIKSERNRVPRKLMAAAMCVVGVVMIVG